MKKEREELAVVLSACPKIRSSSTRCEAFAEALGAETYGGPHVPTSHGMRRVKDEKSGAWRGILPRFSFRLVFSAEKSREDRSAFAATVNSRL